MNILAIADRPPEKPIPEILRQNNIDVIVTLGDLELHQIRGLELVTDIPKLGVYGNHCSGMYFESLGIQNMHLQTVEIGGRVFGGFEGCVRYKNSPTAKMYTQEESIQMLAEFPRVDVMLTHAPPFGINDEPDDVTHAGFKGLENYVHQHEPAYLFHGHTYPEDPDVIRKVGNTSIVYVSGTRVVEI